MTSTDQATSALARPCTLAEDWTQLADSSVWEPGLQIGPYRLQRQLGKGGMGVVWLAEQLHPLQRDVAIKVMAAGRGDSYREAWFEIERQALAQLSHPGIAQIHDAGRLPDGAMFFAMEYVPGQPLDAFQQQHPLGHRAVAELFVQICAAVQHAHQRGLIHRDLKPLNVLVRMLDGAPVAKIIDFGIAVRTLPGSGVFVESNRIVGTPAYMSPDQRNPGPQGIDARADIYALGVMLVEALCRSVNPGASLDVIDISVVQKAATAEVDFPNALPGEADDTSRAALQACPKELLAIAGKAIAREREHRYASAAAMAEDLGRWLACRPVAAVGGGRLYELSCLVRRNRIASVAAMLVLLAIVAGSAMAVHGMTQAQQALALAEQRRDDAEQLIQFMLGDFADKLRPIGRLDLLDSVSTEALRYLVVSDGSLTPASALRRARALRTLGEVRTTRQQFADAQNVLEAADATLQPALLENPEHVDLHFEAGQIAFYRGAVDYRQERFDAAEPHWQRYLLHAEALQKLQPDGATAMRELGYAYTNLGTLAERRSDLPKALIYFQRAGEVLRGLVSAASEPAALDLANNLSWTGRIQFALGNVAEAWLHAQEALHWVQAHRQAGGSSAGQRQLEINQLYVLARYALLLQRDMQATEWMRQALALATEDVAIDATQPRRQLMFVRIAFQLAARPNLAASEAKIAFAAGERALHELAEGRLSATEHIELQLWQEVARRGVGLAGADGIHHSSSKARITLQSALRVIEEATASADSLLVAAAELALGLDPPDPSALAQLQHLLTSQSHADRGSDLGSLILRHRLAESLGQMELAVALNSQIAEWRASVDALDSPPGKGN